MILEQFCLYSGYKFNPSMSKVCFSANTEETVRNMLAAVLGFQVEVNLGTYVGVPLFYTRTTKRTFQFVVDNVQKRLNGFDGKMLSFAGRVTLVNYYC